MAHIPEDLAYFSFPILTKQQTDDGAVIVSGKATGPELDLDGQVIDREFARTAMREWFDSFANIRQMHSPHLAPAGKAVELDQREDGDYITVRVVEPGAVKLVNEGVYSAFSVGIAKPRIVRDIKRAPNGVIVGGRVVENSLVDHPANVACKFLISKRADVDSDEVEYVGKAFILVDDAFAEVDLTKASEFDGVAHTEPHVHEHSHDNGVTHSHSHSHAEGDALHDGADAGHVHDDSADKAAEPDLTKCACGCACAPGKPDPNCDCPCADCVAARGGDAEIEKADEAAKGAVTPTTYELQRLHDLVCGSLDWQTVADNYPSVTKNGVAAALGSPTMSMIYQMLVQEVSEDGGNGSECDDIHHLAGAYKCLCEFLNDEAMEAAVMEDARADLTKDAASGRTYYTTAARDQAKQIMAQLHAHIAALFPDLCPMTANTLDEVPVIVGDQDNPGAKAATITATQDEPVAEVTVTPEAPDLTKLIATTIAAAIDEVTQTYTLKIEALQAQIDQLGAEPDPARAPMRGMAGLTLGTKSLVAEKTTAVAEAQKRAAERERQQEIALLQQLAANSTSELRYAAADRLAALQQH